MPTVTASAYRPGSTIRPDRIIHGVAELLL